MSARRKKPMKDWADVVAEKIAIDMVKERAGYVLGLDIERWAQWIREADCADRCAGFVPGLRAAARKGTKKR